MQNNLSSWISAFRLRTLPLAFSSIILGGFLSFFFGDFRFLVTCFSLLTTLFLQILSNLANDYGDTSHGVDNKNRVGPERTVQSGKISKKSMKIAIIIFSLLSLFSGLTLVAYSFGFTFSIQIIIFIIIGLLAIGAAINYTIGKNPFGYSGLGDFFVFIFFGLVGVVGTFYLNTQQIIPDILLPAAAIGLFSTGVLNLNNMRDVENDKKSGKKTLVVKLGISFAKKYHFFLLVLPFIFLIIFTLLNYFSIYQYSFVLLLPLLFLNLNALKKSSKDLDPFLKRLTISSFLFIFVFGIGLILAKSL